MSTAPTGQIAAVILAAGMATRFRAADPASASKVLAQLDGKPLLRHVVDAALASRARPVIVVTGHAQADVAAALAGLDVIIAHNADYASGLASSLKRGLVAVPKDCSGLVVLLGDMPRVSAAIIDRLIAALAARPGALAVVPTFSGQRANPVVIARAAFPLLARIEGDQGARRVLQAAGGKVIELPIDDDAVTTDIDTPEALRALKDE
ncbi:nucleotidyltransferase family protein [Roseiarcaceae bacterium H3SJ34-1]|uniref:nucleotidyltransferase family protein n=1 Tax=Terripilifer ovatus TaxID=3032367 RepID=UPI003AB9AAEE|nr:nucleotidyltransferase family protein [Roseiarcaceae bacterium H3SJ34-1]